MMRPSRWPTQARSGKAMRPPADDVEQHATRGAEENGETRGEDAPERLAEDPDDQPPADAPQSGQPRPPTAGGDEEEHPDAQLDPHGGGGGATSGDGSIPRHRNRPGVAPIPGSSPQPGARRWTACRAAWPAAIAGVHRPPRAPRSRSAARRRARGSGEVAGRGGGNGAPRATARRYCRDRNPFQATNRRTSTRRIKAACRPSAVWKSWMIVELPAPGAWPIPGIRRQPSPNSLSPAWGVTLPPVVRGAGSTPPLEVAQTQT